MQKLKSDEMLNVVTITMQVSLDHKNVGFAKVNIEISESFQLQLKEYRTRVERPCRSLDIFAKNNIQ